MYVPTDERPVYRNYVERIKWSWTWARLTEEERGACLSCLSNVWCTGNDEQDEWNLRAVYRAFLRALGCGQPGWRE